MIRELIIKTYSNKLKKEDIEQMIGKIPEVYAIVLKERQMMFKN
jgi:hypothetical protein